MFSKFYKGFKSDLGNELKTTNTEKFADTISVELKTAAVNAITDSLESLEGKYLRGILENSFFPLKSLIFIPNDSEVAMTIEEFIRVHEEIDKDFKLNFFKGILQKEYRSSRGSVVKIGDSFVPELQYERTSIEKNSKDENFQISLKGRKILFTAIASLGKPVRRNVESNERQFENKKLLKKKICVLITDGDGHRKIEVSLPLIIGRDPEKKNLDYGYEIVTLNSKYVSRNQLIVFFALDQLLFYVPEDASLTCVDKIGKKLELGRLYSVSSSDNRLYFGYPKDHSGPMTGNMNPAEFPIIEIESIDEVEKLHTKTPRPKLDF